MSVKRCANCDHPVYRHEPQDMELCRIVGCPCPGFLTPRPGRSGRSVALDRAIKMVRFAHHDHPFGDEHCTPTNCSVEEFLVGDESKEEGAGS